MSPVRTAVFPVAGLGTRLLPATKAIPKELLPIVDRPLIQYAVDEAREAGIENFIFVTGRGKTAIEDHFDRNFDLETAVAKRGDQQTLEMLKDLRSESSQFTYVQQLEPLGLGNAVWCARHLVEDESFAVLLPDDFLRPSGEALRSMIDLHEETGSNIVLVQEVPTDQTHRYGIITPEHDSDGAMIVGAIQEKPEPGTAQSNFAIVGRYILDAETMSDLGRTPPGTGGEIQLTDALCLSLARKQLRAAPLTGQRFDCGSIVGLISATLAVALDREDIRGDVEDVIRGYL